MGIREPRKSDPGVSSQYHTRIYSAAEYDASGRGTFNTSECGSWDAMTFRNPGDGVTVLYKGEYRLIFKARVYSNTTFAFKGPIGISVS